MNPNFLVATSVVKPEPEISKPNLRIGGIQNLFPKGNFIVKSPLCLKFIIRRLVPLALIPAMVCLFSTSIWGQNSSYPEQRQEMAYRIL